MANEPTLKARLTIENSSALASVAQLGNGVSGLRGFLGALGRDLLKFQNGLVDVKASIAAVNGAAAATPPVVRATEGWRAALSSVLGVTGSIRNTLLLAGAALAAAAVAAKVLVSGLRDAVQAGAALAILSLRTGMSAGSLALLSKEFQNMGVDAGSSGQKINMMQRAIAGVSETGEATNETFAELNLNMAALRKLAPEEQFQKIIAALAGMKDQARQTDAAMKIFGRGGGDMLPLIKAGPQNATAAKWALGDSAALLEKDSGTFLRIANLFSNIGDKFRSFFIGVMDRLGPALLPILEAFNKIDFTELGQLFGNVIAGAIRAVSLIAKAFNLIFDGLNKLGVIRDPNPVTSAPGTTVPGAGLAPIGDLGHEKEADRLARIGGFIGHTSHGGVMSEVAKNTAVAAQKLTAIHQTLVEKSWGISPHPAKAAVTW